MSPPDTNLSKQKRRHRPALWGMGLAILFVALLFTWFLGTQMNDDPASGEGAGDGGQVPEASSGN